MYVSRAKIGMVRRVWAGCLVGSLSCLALSNWLVWGVGGVGLNISLSAKTLARGILYFLAIVDCSTGFWFGYGEEETEEEEESLFSNLSEWINRYPFMILGMLLSPAIYSVVLTTLFRNKWDVFLALISIVFLVLVRPQLKIHHE